MKAKKKIKSTQKNKMVMNPVKVVGMENRQKIVLIKNDIDKMTEDEIKDLLEKISKENKELRKIYYAQNTPVMRVKNRKFSDLVKKFVGTLREENKFQMIGEKSTM